MTARLKRLNDSDMHLLEKIFEFSGYTTCPSISNYKTDRDISNNRRFLYKLVEEGYLKENRFYSDSNRDVIIYQVAAKTCKLLGNPDSYFRKKHCESYIIRALIKQHFFFEICSDFDASIVSLHESRVSLLTEELGFSIDVLPKKRDGDTCTTHVEEYILDARSIKQGSFICRQTGNTLFNFGRTNRGIIFVYIDKSDISFYKQIMSLYDRYKAMIEKELVQIDFLIVVDSEAREAAYKQIIKKYFKSPDKEVQAIHENYIKLHAKILEDTLNFPLYKTQGLPEKIKQKYSQPQELTEQDFEGIPIKDIRANGIKAVKKAALDAIRLLNSPEEKLACITEFFSKFYKLYSAGKLKKGADFDIKVYRIGHKFSL